MIASAWVTLAITLGIIIFICGVCIFCWIIDVSKSTAVFICIITIAIVIGLFCGIRRELINQKSNFNNGLERVITVYTADGKEMARYEGQIDISSADGYVKFDVDGKRYIYYNCFVESIANIED